LLFFIYFIYSPTPEDGQRPKCKNLKQFLRLGYKIQDSRCVNDWSFICSLRVFSSKLIFVLEWKNF